MLLRRLGRDRAREVAACSSLDEALGVLAASAYGRALMPGMDLAAAQRALADTALWHVRVLAGWTPPRALAAVRALAGWFELANIEDRVAYLRGAPGMRPFALGGLASAWPRLAGVQTVGELRAGLATSVWGDPGTEAPAELGLVLRFSWARRVLDAVEEAEPWAAGAVALVLAREMLLAGRSPSAAVARRAPGVGGGWYGVRDVEALRDVLPGRAAWVLADVAEPEDLWRAEVGWWLRVESDAERLARSVHLGRAAVMGSVVLLGVDAWRTAAALEVAARGGAGPAMEIFERLV
jgi:hypothetical protein